jgi:hypothetical protein
VVASDRATAAGRLGQERERGHTGSSRHWRRESNHFSLLLETTGGSARRVGKTGFYGLFAQGEAVGR